ncbi:MAG: hypothetical protein JO069_04855 [Verrucomicrobia bacterium]|nr:hypothetical protein [Verrucomicrobiota bacterium]
MALAIALADQGRLTEGTQSAELLAQAVSAFRCALEVNTREQLPQAWVTTQTNFAHALWTLGEQLAGEEGLNRLRESVEAFRQLLTYQPRDQRRFWLARDLGGLAFHLILTRQFAGAQTCCQEAQKLANELGDAIEKKDRDDLIFIQGNLAHTLLFQGHYDEALAICRQNWSRPLMGKTFGEITLEDFAAFDKAGLTHPDLPRMKHTLEALRPEAAGKLRDDGKPNQEQ